MSWAQCLVDISALNSNISTFRNFCPNSQLLAMVKSKAYGHSFDVCEHIEKNVDGFGVADINEASALRHLGVTTKIVAMQGFYTPADLANAIKYDIELVVHNKEQVAILTHSNLTHALRIWVMVDTGMGRLGFLPQQVSEVSESLAQCPHVQKPLHYMSHFSEANIETDKKTLQQLNSFFAVTESLPGPRSIANSAGVFSTTDSHLDWIRPGLSLYGVSPFSNLAAEKLQLKPVMTLRSQLMAIKDLPKGHSVGYGSTWQCPMDMRVGIVGIGYGYGYPANMPSGTPTLINGQTAPTVGRVSMDMLAVDLTQVNEPRMGQEVILWGEGLPVEEIAACAKMIPYELLAGITSRAERMLINK